MLICEFWPPAMTQTVCGPKTHARKLNPSTTQDMAVSHDTRHENKNHGLKYPEIHYLFTLIFATSLKMRRT